MENFSYHSQLCSHVKPLEKWFHVNCFMSISYQTRWAAEHCPLGLSNFPLFDLSRAALVILDALPLLFAEAGFLCVGLVALNLTL